MFKMMGEASAMFKVLGGGEGRKLCSRIWEGVRGVSHVQGSGRGEWRQLWSR